MQYLCGCNEEESVYCGKWHEYVPAFFLFAVVPLLFSLWFPPLIDVDNLDVQLLMKATDLLGRRDYFESNNVTNIDEANDYIT